VHGLGRKRFSRMASDHLFNCCAKEMSPNQELQVENGINRQCGTRKLAAKIIKIVPFFSL
jgi:hypothetical protein